MANLSSDFSSSEETEIYYSSSDEDTGSFSFKWKNIVMTPKLFNFTEDSGPKNINDDICEPFEIFRLLFDQEVMNLLVEETNKYQSQNKINERMRMPNWVDTTINEIAVFIGLMMLTGLVKKNRITDYWSTNELIKTPIFSQMMSRNRFVEILRCLHFSDNQTLDPQNRLGKLGNIPKILKKNFSNYFSPSQELCIDESMMLYKGRLSFKQYIPSKRHRFGIKLFELVDSRSRYIMDFIVYTGSTTEINITQNLGTSGSIVKTLMLPFLSKSHHLYTDNWYSSPDLFQFLYENETGACGTIRKNRRNIPKLTANLRPGEHQISSTSNMMIFKWMDKREVYMLTTIHDFQMVRTGKQDRRTNQEKVKPNVVIEYSKFMGGVDKSDMEMSFSESTRKTIKWYRKFFFHLLDICVHNAHVIHQKKTKKSTHLSDFKLEIINSIFQKFGPQKPLTTGRPSTTPSPSRLSGNHFISEIPQTNQARKPQRRCVVCSSHNIRKDTRYMCQKCDISLCMNECFENYHTKLHY